MMTVPAGTAVSVEGASDRDRNGWVGCRFRELHTSDGRGVGVVGLQSDACPSFEHGEHHRNASSIEPARRSTSCAWTCRVDKRLHLGDEGPRTSIATVIAVPETGSWRRLMNSSLGSESSRIPSSPRSKHPTSSAGPKRFFEHGPGAVERAGHLRR